MGDEFKTGLMEFIAAATALSERRRGLIQRLAIRRMLRKGMIDETVAKTLELKDWQSFIEWVIENGPAIMEFIMMIIALFGGI